VSLDRRTADDIAARLMLVVTLFACSLIFILAFTLLRSSVPILSNRSLTELLLSDIWNPPKGEFGLFPFIVGTLIVTGIAMVIAIPTCFLTAIYLAEYAPSMIRKIVKPPIDLLAGIPSVVFGLWGVLLVVPIIRDFIAPLVGATSTGYCVLAGGIVLAIMVFPIIISISEEVFKTIPFGMREASLSLGATKWQTVKHVVVRKGLPGFTAAVTLGFGRAFGETMAVLMVMGNVAKIPTSLFDSGYALPALIANNYGEMMSIPMYDSALLFAALVLLAVIAFFSVLARLVLMRVQKRSD
jgi:phosphate transport system permease protein